ncbi:peptidase U32 [Ferroglobus placidus DSM 10642]|uniref:Peptidase U32 n=1 Tax=Ferroglobus placidus (strain DSM 10642 / AEDII12DO) TaxID=589924 RepID=D3S0J4_FERPA|nr:U32 family peptidase [Ferroglobus placidus]ADC64208.1 peptidase U32 [Ferroglobus placidus DSM 10642]
MKYVGLKGFSKYGDEKALTVEEINRLAENEEVFVALNRVKEADEIEKAAKNLKASGVIVNEIAAIKRIEDKKVIASVGLNPLNSLDLELLKELGAYAVVIPPEINENVEELKGCGVKIEAFKRAYVEMFYKGKCLLSAYFSGVSAKRDGVCKKECCRRWKVVFKEKEFEVSFPPKLVEYDVNADILKFEGRQFSKIGVMSCGINDERSES